MKNEKLGSKSVVKIDGRRIKEIRESKGLTQLYVATFVGVTTDTISRWENRKYPRIKRENAQKLAEALEVSLEEILEDEPDSTEPKKIQPNSTDNGSTSKRQIAILLGIFFLFGVSYLLFKWRYPKETSIIVFAQRSLPTQVAPGSRFPVIITLKKPVEGRSSILIRETIPRTCELVGYFPKASAMTTDKNMIQWIFPISDKGLELIYVLRLSANGKMDKPLRFKGIVIPKGRPRTDLPIGGDTSAKIGPFHWADKDANGVIDDQEILDAFDRLGSIEQLQEELHNLEALWAGGTYAWDKEGMKFIAQKGDKDVKE